MNLKFNDNFWKWFGKSKVVDENKAPLRVYHATNQEFNEFKIGEFGYHFGNLKQAKNMESIKNNSKIIPVYLRIENPLYTIDFIRWNSFIMSKIFNKYNVISNEEMKKIHKYKYSKDQDNELKNILKNKGYDGIIYDNEFEGKGKSYIVFDANQIKSAIQNNGNYNVNSNSIYENNFISFKSYKQKLNERVETLTDLSQVTHYFRDDDVISYAFCFIDDNLILSNIHGSHGDAVKNYIGMKSNNMDYDLFDKIYKKIKYEGRLWLNYEIISFRDIIVPEYIINKLKIDLKKYFPNKDFSNFKVETK